MFLVLVAACTDRPLPDHHDPSFLALALAPDWIAEVDDVSAALGTSVSSAGDVNGDGFDDVVVGAYLYGLADDAPGAAFVYLGSTTGPSATPDWTTVSDQDESHLGFAVSSAGDVNGDGFDDVLVGAPDYDGPQADEEDLGRVYLFEGSATGLEATASWAIDGEQEGAALGSVLGRAGDVNGDGFDDVLVAAPLFDGAQIDEGAVWLYDGSATGLETFAEWSSGIDLAGAHFGASVAGAGDVNDDGFDDVAIGAPFYDDGVSEDEGRVHVYFGSASGLPTGGPSWIGQNDEAGLQLGTAVGFVDVDADGFDDVLVGAANAEGSVPALSHQGEVAGFRGSATVPSATSDWTVESDASETDFGAALAGIGDLNGDGFGDLAVGAPFYDAEQGAVFLYGGSSSGFGAEDGRLENADTGHLGAAVAAAGDVNGDGLADLVAGAPDNTHGQNAEGQVFLVLGACVGIDSDADTILDSCDRCPGFDDRQDTDGDVVPDDCDVCPLVADPGQEDSNGNGVGDACADADDDGFLEDADCDDTDPAVYPGATEVCDGKDTTCAGTLPADEVDADSDGFYACNGECDDTNPLRHPGATEDCDGLDDDCDGAFPFEVDQDGDGFMGCDGDCDDANPARHGGALEVCNDVDDNCNGDVDEACGTEESGGCGCNGAGTVWPSGWLVALSLLISYRCGTPRTSRRP